MGTARALPFFLVMDYQYKKRKICERAEPIDRISQLPICILQNILSYLPLKDEARTCILSKSWHKELRWTLRPQRSFRFNQCQSIGNDLALYTDQSVRKFIQDVEDSLHRLQHNERIRIPLFSVLIGLLNSEISFFIDSWIHLAASNYLRRFILLINTKKILTDLYQFPNIRLVSLGRLTMLTLRGCKLQRNSLCDDDDVENIQPFALQELSLYNVEVDNRDNIFQKFISRCSSLNKLSIKLCNGVESLRLCNHPKLKELHIQVQRDDIALVDLLQRIEVDSLNLQTITCSSVNTKKSLIVEATRCSNLRHLDMNRTEIEEGFFQDLGTNYSLLRTLSLRISNTRLPKLINLRHPLLKTVKLDFTCLDKLSSIDIPNLCLFECTGYSIPTELIVPSTSLLRLKKSCLTLYLRRQLNTLWFRQLRGYLGKFNKHNLNLRFDIHYPHMVFNMNKFGTDLDLPACYVHVLNLKLLDVSPESCAALINGLFWSCHPKYLCLRTEENDSFKVFCEILITAREEIPTCCTSRHMKCWRHFLKDVTIKGVDTSEADASQIESVMQRLAAKKTVYFTLTWL